MTKAFGAGEYYWEKVDHLFTRLEDGWDGAIWTDGGSRVAYEAETFVADQFNRFKIPIPPDSPEILTFGSILVANMVNFHDPYFMFWGTSDVLYTDEWSKYVYEIIDDGERYEADPEYLDVFRKTDRGAENFFNEYIAKPGYKALPAHIKHSIDDIMFDVGEGLWLSYSGVDYNLLLARLHNYALRSGLAKDEEEAAVRADAYIDLSIWAGVLWVLGPFSREQRIATCEVTETVLQHGEAVIYRGAILDPSYYRRIERQPASCHQCGVQAWCIEQVMTPDGSIRFICEGCATRGMERFNGATCGTKFCKYFDCPHNLYHQKGTAAVRNYMNKQGQLGQKAAAGRKAIEAAMVEQKKLGSG